jgi:hypothetical protein
VLPCGISEGEEHEASKTHFRSHGCATRLIVDIPMVENVSFPSLKERRQKKSPFEKS